MKYNICLHQEYVVRECGETSNLDSEYFRNLPNNPYTGNNDKEFLEYIQSFLENPDNKKGLSEDVIEELDKLDYGSSTDVYYDSREKTYNTWLEYENNNVAIR